MLFRILITSLMLASPLAMAYSGTPVASSKQALDELLAGNKRFITGRTIHAREDAKTRKELVASQSPHAIILSCSDSRVPPELVFDQGLGRLFTIRVAGNVATSDTIASIEYAVEHLGTRLLVVLGHESCGAVQAALATKEGMSAGSPDLDKLVADIRPALSNFQDLLPADKAIRGPVRANVSAQARALLDRSAILREAVAQKKLIISQAIYDLDSGKVEFWDASTPAKTH